MASPIFIPKKSTIASKVPTTSDLQPGEICVNYADAKIYGRHPSNSSIVALSGTSTATQAALDAKADLVNGLVPASQLPSYVQSVAGRTGAVTLTLSDLGQSGATSGQVPTWSGSAWVPKSPTFFEAYEHFISNAGIGLLGLTYAGLNGGSITQITTNPAVFGAVRMATANNSTANTGARINGSGSINTLNPTGVGEFRFVSRIMRFSADFFSSATRGIFRTGLGDSINAGPSNGFFFTAQESNTVNFNTVAGGVTTSTPTGFSILQNQWNLFEFVIAANGLSVTAKINNNVVATHTTNIPSAYMFPITNMLKYLPDAGFVQMDVDYIYISLS